MEVSYLLKSKTTTKLRLHADRVHSTKQSSRIRQRKESEGHSGRRIILERNQKTRLLLTVFQNIR